MLIGVDHGNKQIKTVHCNPFVSGLKQSVTRPFGQNVLRYQNNRMIGQLRLQPFVLRSNRPTAVYRVLIAIFRYLLLHIPYCC